MYALAFAALVVGATLFLSGSNRIFRHDDGSGAVMVRSASGFTLIVVAVALGIFTL
jgi:hypothetical protein